MDLLGASDHGERERGGYVVFAAVEAGHRELEGQVEEDRLVRLGGGCDGDGVSFGKCCIKPPPLENEGDHG